MSLDPDLAKKVLKLYPTSFKKMLDEHSSYGLLGDFDPHTASAIHLNIERYYGADDAFEVAKDVHQLTFTDVKVLEEHFLSLLDKMKCCMCSRLEIKDFDELVFFHPDAERMTRQANDFLTLLQKLNPGLCTPKQTSCICLQCLKTIKEHFDKITASVDRIDHSSWDKESEPFQSSLEQSEASSSAQSSNRAMKMWKVPSFGSQSSGTDVDLFEIDWELCLICQIASDEQLLQGKELEAFVKFAENYLWIFRNRFENPFSDINPDIYFSECVPLDAQNLGKHLFEHHGKYHRSCKLRYSNAKVDRYRKPKAAIVKPAAKASKRDRHVSAHDNVEEALKNAGIEAVRNFIMEHEEVSPGLYPVIDLEKHYNEHVRTNLPTSGVAGVESSHTTRFAERIEEAIPGLKRFMIGRAMYVCFDDRIVAALSASLDSEEEEYSVMSLKISRKIRKELSSYSNTFMGKYDASILANTPSSMLRALMNALLDGDPESVSSEANTLTDIIQHNYRTIKSPRKSSFRRKSPKKETPHFQYLSLHLYGLVPSRTLFDYLFSCGIVVNYQRVRELINILVATSLQQFYEDGAVVPLNLRLGLFLIGCKDNLDLLAQSTTAGGSFHGTTVSLFQQPTKDNMGVKRTRRLLCNVDPDTTFKVPEFFRLEFADLNVRKLSTYKYSAPVECQDPKMLQYDESVNICIEEERKWITDCVEIVLAREESENPAMSNLVYHSRKENSVQPLDELTISALLPVQTEPAATLEMMQHCIDLIRAAKDVVNPSQKTTFDVSDNPLYRLSKQIQFAHPEEYSLQSHLPLMGDLHTEQVCMHIQAQLIEKTGLEEVLDACGLTIEAPKSAVLNVPMITRARYMMELIVIALEVLKKKAYEAACSDVSMEEWRADRSLKYVNFVYWEVVQEFQITVLAFVRSIRERKFERSRAILSALTKYFFALDHTHYARWTPVSLFDLEIFKELSPVEYGQLKDFFTVTKTRSKLSAMALDQGHEQNNARIKSVKGALAFLCSTEEESRLKWDLYSPEFLRLEEEFQQASNLTAPPLSVKKHHNDSPTFQKTFLGNVAKLVTAAESIFNPFASDHSTLRSLRNGLEITDSAEIEESIRSLKKMGEEQYHDYAKERLFKSFPERKPLTDAIKNNTLTLPSNCKLVEEKWQGMSDKKEKALLRDLQVIAPQRPEAVENALRYEPNGLPLVFLSKGKMYSNAKSSVVPRFKQLGSCASPLVDDVVVDLPHFLYSSATKSALKTIRDLFNAIWRDVKALAGRHNANRLALVQDRYDVPNPLKASAHTSRGSGLRRPITLDSMVPSHFREDYLKNAENKAELYKLLIAFLHELSQNESDLTVYITNNRSVLSNKGPSFFEPCNHIEADTRVAVFVYHAVIAGSSSILVRTGDTDVIFILIGQVRLLLQEKEDLKLFLEMHSSSTQYLDIVALARSIGLQYSDGLPLLHAYTGCDYTPSFFSIGKAKWFDAFVKQPEIMALFQKIIHEPSSVEAEELLKVSQFTLSVYGVSDPSKGLLQGRFDRLTDQKVTSFRSLPPSPGAVIIQFRKAVHIAAHIWGKACQSELCPPDICHHLQGWEQVGGRIVHRWTVFPEPSNEDNYKLCQTRCGCRKKENICRGRCSCHDAHLPCLYSCKCRRKCHE